MPRSTAFCVKTVQIRSFSGPYFPVFSPNTGKYGSEKTPYLDTFHTAASSTVLSNSEQVTNKPAQKYKVRQKIIFVTKEKVLVNQKNLSKIILSMLS